MNRVRSMLIILFGAMPASILCWFAGLAVVVGGPNYVATGDLAFFLVLIWGLAGIAGTIALWMAALGPMTAPVYLGLFMGLLAIAPFTIGVDIGSKSLAEGFFQYSAVSTFVVIIFLFVELGRRVRAFSKAREDSTNSN